MFESSEAWLGVRREPTAMSTSSSTSTRALTSLSSRRLSASLRRSCRWMWISRLRTVSSPEYDSRLSGTQSRSELDRATVEIGVASEACHRSTSPTASTRSCTCGQGWLRSWRSPPPCSPVLCTPTARSRCVSSRPRALPVLAQRPGRTEVQGRPQPAGRGLLRPHRTGLGRLQRAGADRRRLRAPFRDRPPVDG